MLENMYAQPATPSGRTPKPCTLKCSVRIGGWGGEGVHVFRGGTVLIPFSCDETEAPMVREMCVV